MKNLAIIKRSCNKNFAWRLWKHIWLLDIVIPGMCNNLGLKKLNEKRFLSENVLKIRIWIKSFGSFFCYFHYDFCPGQICSERINRE